MEIFPSDVGCCIVQLGHHHFQISPSFTLSQRASEKELDDITIGLSFYGNQAGDLWEVLYSFYHSEIEKKARRERNGN